MVESPYWGLLVLIPTTYSTCQAIAASALVSYVKATWVVARTVKYYFISFVFSDLNAVIASCLKPTVGVVKCFNCVLGIDSACIVLLNWFYVNAVVAEIWVRLCSLRHVLTCPVLEMVAHIACKRSRVVVGVAVDRADLRVAGMFFLISVLLFLG